MKPLAIAISLVGHLAACSAYALNCQSALSTPDLNECAQQEQRAVEAKLNQVYQKALKSVSEPTTEQDAETKRKLIQAQRAWVKFRDADCEAVYSRFADGSMRNIMFMGCMQQHAERRIADLEFISEDH